MTVRYFILLNLLAHAGLLHASEYYIEMLPKVSLGQNRVELQQIANVSASGVSGQSELGHITVMTMKSLAVPTKITRSQLEAVISHYDSNVASQITWGSVNATVVESLPQSVSIESGVNLAAVWVVSELQKSLGPVTADYLGSADSIFLPVGHVSQKPKFDAAKWGVGFVRLPLEIYVDDFLLVKRELVFKFGQVKKADEAVSKKESLPETLALPVNRRIGRNEEKLLTHSVAIGVHDDGLFVIKNQPVQMLVESGAVQIEAAAIALEDGYLGQQVSVQTKDHASVVQATVINRGQVAIKD